MNAINMEDHLPMVRKMAQRMWNRFGDNTDINEFINDGILGLHKAIKGHKPGLGSQFTTYAHLCVRGAIYRGNVKRSRLSARAMKRKQEISSARNRLEQSNGGTVSCEAIADDMAITLDTCYLSIADIADRQTTSLDKSIAFNGSTASILVEVVADMKTMQSEDDIVLHVDMSNALRTLTSEERQVITLHFMKDKELKDIAVAVGKSYNSVKNTKRRALRKLGEQLKDKV